MIDSPQTILAWSFVLSVLMTTLFITSIALRLVEQDRVTPQTERAILVRMGLVLLSVTLMVTSVGSVVEIDSILLAMVGLLLRGFAITLGFTLNIYEIKRIRSIRAYKETFRE